MASERRESYKDDTNENVTWECYLCKTTFTNRANLKRHMEGAHLPKTWICEFCFWKFGGPYSLKSHEGIHEFKFNRRTKFNDP